MKRARLIITIVVLGLIAVGVFLWKSQLKTPLPEPTGKSKSVTNIPPSPRPIPAVQAPTSGNAGTPKLFKSKRYPPETPEEKAMWEWWNRMEKTDIQFQWKMPIEFYGVVVDQSGAPVTEAKVDLQWSVIGGTQEKHVTTLSDGSFELNGAVGKGLSVSIHKEGYLPTKESGGSFEYAAFFENNFHTPRRGQPVAFRIQKLLGTEPFYIFSFNGKTTPDGPALWLNVEKGKFASTGDFSFAVSLGDKRTRMGQEYTITVQSQNGATLAPTSEEFPFLAPAEGYQTTITLGQAANDPNYQQQKNLKFYAKLPGGRYAFVGVEVNVIPGGDVVLSGAVRYNEKWSRNLEFDHRKWINR